LIDSLDVSSAAFIVEDRSKIKAGKEKRTCDPGVDRALLEHPPFALLVVLAEGMYFSADCCALKKSCEKNLLPSSMERGAGGAYVALALPRFLVPVF